MPTAAMVRNPTFLRPSSSTSAGTAASARSPICPNSATAGATVRTSDDLSAAMSLSNRSRSAGVSAGAVAGWATLNEHSNW